MQNLEKMRTRISQYLILPPFQRKGFGTIILDVLYKDVIANEKCLEITVEDPSDSFQAMRDIYDVKLILRNNYFQIFKTVLQDFQKNKINILNYHQIRLSKKEKNQIHTHLKLTNSRIERCFELLKFAKLDSADKEVIDKFRIDVKKRQYILNKDFLIPGERMDKIQKKIIRAPFIYLGDEESPHQSIEAAISEAPQALPLDFRKEFLANLYEELVREYSLVIKEINKIE